jgi:hypothetical protein
MCSKKGLSWISLCAQMWVQWLVFTRCIVVGRGSDSSWYQDFCFEVLGIKLRVSCMLGKCSTFGFHPYPWQNLTLSRVNTHQLTLSRVNTHQLNVVTYYSYWNWWQWRTHFGQLLNSLVNYVILIWDHLISENS